MSNILRVVRTSILITIGLMTASCVYDPLLYPAGVGPGGPPRPGRPVAVVATGYHRALPGHAPYGAVVHRGEAYRGPGGPAAGPARGDFRGGHPSAASPSRSGPSSARAGGSAPPGGSSRAAPSGPGGDDHKPKSKGGDKKDKGDGPPPKKR